MQGNIWVQMQLQGMGNISQYLNISWAWAWFGNMGISGVLQSPATWGLQTSPRDTHFSFLSLSLPISLSLCIIQAMEDPQLHLCLTSSCTSHLLYIPLCPFHPDAV